MRQSLQFVLPALLLLAACGSSGGGGTTDVTTENEVGSVILLLDTRAGGDSWVQFQLAGATLEGPGGLQTANLLREARILTVADPSGEPTGVRLARAPVADYQALHLIFVPGSGVARDAAGNNLPVTGPIDVRVPIMEGLQHDGTTPSWLVVGYDNAALTTQGTGATWAPELSGRIDGAELTLSPLTYPVVRDGELHVTASMADDSVLTVREAAQCTYRDEEGNGYASREAFYAALAPEDDVCVSGTVSRTGRIHADIICREPRYAQSRLIGRVLQLDANAQRFRFRVQAVNPRGSGPMLEAPVQIWVDASNASIERPNGSVLTFGDLAVDQLAKVKWNSYATGGDGLLVYQATEVEVPGANSGQHHKQWQARVISVDLANDSFVIEPRNGGSIRVGGQVVSQATVVVDANTSIERRAAQGGGRSMITLSEILPGSDRVWVRGRAAGPQTIAATRVRVREE